MDSAPQTAAADTSEEAGPAGPAADGWLRRRRVPVAVVLLLVAAAAMIRTQVIGPQPEQVQYLLGASPVDDLRDGSGASVLPQVDTDWMGRPTAAQQQWRWPDRQVDDAVDDAMNHAALHGVEVSPRTVDEDGCLTHRTYWQGWTVINQHCQDGDDVTWHGRLTRQR